MQIILLYLEERYGDQNNKSIKAVAYPEDIHNLRLHVTRFPEHTAATLWHEKLTTQEVVKPRAKGKVFSNTASSSDAILHDTSFDTYNFQSIVSNDQVLQRNDDEIVLFNKTIESSSASQIFCFFRENNSQIQLEGEKDPDDANIVLKTIKLFG